MRNEREDGPSSRPARWACAIIFVATLAQLLVALAVPDLPQFHGKAFGARAVLFPLMMLLLPVGRWLVRRRHGAQGPDRRGWVATALVMTPFLIDVTGNTMNLYDAVTWWDDWCHFSNWALLLSGIGLLIDPDRRAPRSVRMLAIAGLGAICAIVWELGEWLTFIRFGTELATAYQDTLGDLALGTLGSCIAALIVTVRPRRRP